MTGRSRFWLVVALAPIVGACRQPVVPDPANDAERVAETTPAVDAGLTVQGAGAFGGLEGHRASGRVTLSVGADGVAVLVLQDDFAMDPQPDPHLYLNTAATVHRGTPLRLGKLERSRGAQRYTFRLPPGATYTHAVVWCNRYDVGLAQAPLARVP